MNRNRAYYRKARAKHIKRKKKICNNHWYKNYYSCNGMYSKNKIHCSCPYCRGKDYRGKHLKTLSEKRFEDKLKSFYED